MRTKRTTKNGTRCDSCTECSPSKVFLMAMDLVAEATRKKMEEDERRESDANGGDDR